MVLSATLDSRIQQKDQTIDANATCYLPSFVVAMLRNVHLSYDENIRIFVPEGDFWFWKLTYYGLGLMRLLVRTSNTAFSYSETFTESETEDIPQLTLLDQLNKKIHDKLIHPTSEPEWDQVLDCSPYLHDQDIVIDLELFQIEIEKFITRIKHGRYSPSGSRVYRLKQ